MNWTSTEWNDGVKLKAKPGMEFQFKFPTGSGHVNSIQADLSSPLRLGQAISLYANVKVLSGSPHFVALDGGTPANFSVMLAVSELEERWYVSGNTYAALKEGFSHWGVVIKPQYWQDVDGQQDAARFKKALPTFRIIQVVFGGKFRAHGVVCQNGVAQFQLLKFSVL